MLIAIDLACVLINYTSISIKNRSKDLFALYDIDKPYCMPTSRGESIFDIFVECLLSIKLDLYLHTKKLS